MQLPKQVHPQYPNVSCTEHITKAGYVTWLSQVLLEVSSPAEREVVVVKCTSLAVSRSTVRCMRPFWLTTNTERPKPVSQLHLVSSLLMRTPFRC